jgi:hypothetical protein
VSEQYLYSLPFHIECESEGVLISSGAVSFLLKGAHLFSLVDKLSELIKTQQTKNDLIDNFIKDDRVYIQEIIDILIEKRIFFLSEIENEFHEDIKGKIFYSNVDIDASLLKQELAKKTILIAGINTISFLLIKVLKEMGFINIFIYDDPVLRNDKTVLEKNEKKFLINEQELEEKSIDGAALIVIGEFIDRKHMEKWNIFCLKRKISYFPITCNHTTASLGPYVIPEVTACYACFLKREESNTNGKIERKLLSVAASPKFYGFHPGIPHILAGIASMEIAEKMSATWVKKINQVIDIRFIPYESIRRAVLKIPNCYCMDKLL